MLAKGEGVGGEGGRFWIRSAASVLSGPVEPPSGSGFGVNMGPADPFLPQGTQTPGLPTFHFYFPGCKMPLAIRAGGVFFFFSLIFTHKMCISRTKAAMMGPLVSANFLPVLSRNSCAASIRFAVIPSLRRRRLYTDTAMYHLATLAGDFFFNKGDFKGSVLHQLQKIAVLLLNKLCVWMSTCLLLLLDLRARTKT